MTRILTIEDDAELQHMLGQTLGAAGFDVHYAFTGPEGYEKTLALAPDLIVCDMMLPGINGPELIAKLRRHPHARSVPVIVTTAYYDAANLLESKIKALGAVAYLRKPIRLDELLACIRRLAPEKAMRPSALRQPRKGRLRVDPAFRTVWIDDRLAATLPPKRFAALRLLLEAEGEVPRDTMMRLLWGPMGNQTRLEKTIQRLRDDLGAAAGMVRTTQRGYELVC